MFMKSLYCTVKGRGGKANKALTDWRESFFCTPVTRFVHVRAQRVGTSGENEVRAQIYYVPIVFTPMDWD
jgi:hypothetical protein